MEYSYDNDQEKKVDGPEHEVGELGNEGKELGP